MTERFSHVADTGSVPQAPATPEDVPAAREERVSEELAYTGYVEGIYQASEGGCHAEDAAVAMVCRLGRARGIGFRTTRWGQST